MPIYPLLGISTLNGSTYLSENDNFLALEQEEKSQYVTQEGLREMVTSDEPNRLIQPQERRQGRVLERPCRQKLRGTQHQGGIQTAQQDEEKGKP